MNRGRARAVELRRLRYFVAVAEERHFGRAAERLHIAQPPLSQQIRRLEAELGTPLLYRTTRTVQLSPAGEVLLVRAREILAAVDAAAEDARRAARGEYGRLAIGFTGSATYALLPALAAALRDALPGVVLDLRGELLTPAQVARLLDGTLDLGLLRPPVRARELRVEVLRREPLVAVLPAGARPGGGRRGPARGAQGRAVRHLSLPLPLRPARRRRGCLRRARLRAAGGARGVRDGDARELRRGRARRLPRPRVRAPHDGRGRRLHPARRRGHDGRARGRLASRRRDADARAGARRRAPRRRRRRMSYGARNSVRTGASTAGSATWLWPASVSRRACGSAAAIVSAACAK